MAIQEVVKNIYTFSNILSEAHTDIVRHWDLRSLNNAFNWAKYCMKVEEETRNKQFRTDLDRHVQSLTILLEPVSLLQLDLGKLGQAAGHLCKVLLQNSSLPECLMSTLKKVSAEYSVQIESEGPCQRADSRLYQLLGEDVAFCARCHQAKAQHVMTRLLHLKKICSSSVKRFERFLEKFLWELKKHKEGWVVILHMLLTEVALEEDHECVTSLKHTMLTNYHSEASSIHCGIWRCDIELLCNVAVRDDQFCDLYLTFLTSWAESMQALYGLNSSGELYQWRCSQGGNNKETCFEKLIEHFSAILSCNKRLKVKVEKLIAERNEAAYFSVWKDLQKTVILQREI